MYFDLQYVYNTKIRTIRRDENNSRNSRLKSTNNGNKSSSQEESCFGERGYQLSFLQPGADHITIFCVANDCRCHCDSLNNVTLALKCKILISHGEHFMVLEEKNNLLMWKLKGKKSTRILDEVRIIVLTAVADQNSYSIYRWWFIFGRPLITIFILIIGTCFRNFKSRCKIKDSINVTPCENLNFKI